MEILYQINSIDQLEQFSPDADVDIRWLKIPEDYDVFAEHLRDQNPDRTFTLEDWLKWDAQAAPYCGLFKDGKMVARAAAEKYLSDTWETADVRVCRSERGKGYAKQICYFVTKFILEHDKIATCRTEEYNIAMQHVIRALGFKRMNNEE